MTSIKPNGGSADWRECFLYTVSRSHRPSVEKEERSSLIDFTRFYVSEPFCDYGFDYLSIWHAGTWKHTVRRFTLIPDATNSSWFPDRD